MQESIYWLLGAALLVGLVLALRKPSQDSAPEQAEDAAEPSDSQPLQSQALDAVNAERQAAYLRWLQDREQTLTESHEQTLAMLEELSNRLERCSELVGPNQQVQVELDRLQDMVHRGMKQVRTNLSPVGAVPTEGLDLGRALEQIIAKVRAAAPVVLEARIDPAISAYLNDPRKAHVVHVVKEALTNAIQHSGAQRLSLRAEVQNRRMVISVADDGRGFKPDDVRSRRRGLQSMQSRADAARALLQVESAPGAGTIITLSIPLERQLRVMGQQG